jgi:hypothetical protein
MADAKPPVDLEISSAEYSRYVGDAVAWTFVVSNRSATVAYRDLLCELRYFDSTGSVVATNHEYVRLVVQPGETRRARVIGESRWGEGWARGELRVEAAEPLRPLAR